MGTLAWELSLGNFRLGTFAWELSLGNFVWKLSFGNFRLAPQAWGTGLLRPGEPADGNRGNPGAPSFLPPLKMLNKNPSR